MTCFASGGRRNEDGVVRGLLGFVALALVAAGCGSSGSNQAVSTVKTVTRTDPVARVVPVTVAEHPLGNLAAPVQDATSAPWRGGAILAGGLTAADTSTSNVVLVRATGTT